MNADELDRALSEEEILPSSGFAGSVMDAVRREAAAPPPIAFPWRRAWLGLATAVLMLTLMIAAVIAQFGHAAETPAPLPEWTSKIGEILQAVIQVGGHWAILALLVSLVCVKLSISFSARRT